jgi:hypothetical protein
MKTTTLLILLCLSILPGAPVLRAEETVKARKIAINDILSLRVVGEPDLTREVKVDGDGKIDVLYVGTVTVVGKSPSEVAREIRDALDRDWIIDPQVAVDIKQYDLHYVTVMGAVNHAQQVQILPDHRLDDVSIPNGSAKNFSPVAAQGLIQTKITHHRGHESIARERPTPDCVEGGNREDFVTVDDVPIFIAKKHTVGIAIVGNTDCGAGCAHDATDFIGVSAAAIRVDVTAVGRMVLKGKPRSEFAQDARSRFVGGPIGTIYGDVHPL